MDKELEPIEVVKDVLAMAVAQGIWTAFIRIGTLFLVFVVVGLLLGLLSWEDTDEFPHKSGLRVYTDARTGCQYLGTSQGGLVKRDVPCEKQPK